MRFEVPPGATPIDDTDGLIQEDVRTLKGLWVAEAENILEAQALHFRRRQALDSRWFVDGLLRKVHKDMFGQVWSWAGRYRQTELTIGVSPARVNEEIGRLCGDVFEWDKPQDGQMSVLERAARIHHRLTWIHPFKNGNGRHARFMADLHLHTHRKKVPSWPEDALATSTPDRDRYLKAIHDADRHDFRPLTALIERYSS